MSMMSRGKLLKPSEVAERLGVDSATVGRYIREKRLPAIYTAGGHDCVYEADVDAFLARVERPRDAGAITIALINQKGRVGKTTATANLSVLMQPRGMLTARAALCDFIGIRCQSVPIRLSSPLGEDKVKTRKLLAPTQPLAAKVAARRELMRHQEISYDRRA